MNKLRGVLKSKTMIFSFLLVFLGGVEQSLPSIQNSIPPDVYPIIVQVIGLVTAALRWVTNAPLEDK